MTTTLLCLDQKVNMNHPEKNPENQNIVKKREGKRDVEDG